MTHIDKYRGEYENAPESELIALKHQFPDPAHPAHIAACQLLINKQRGREAKTERLAKAAILISLVSLVVAFGNWLFPRDNHEANSLRSQTLSQTNAVLPNLSAPKN